jgi:hypothetical protein
MNRGSNAGEALIFLHVPKSAGTTLNRLIEWEYPLFEMFSVDPVLFRWSRARLFRLPQERLKKFRVFKGHMPFGLHERLLQPATYITVIREPTDRVISAYYFMNNYKLHPNYWKFRWKGWALEDFVRHSPRENVQTKMIAGADYDEPCTAEILAKAKDNLRYFSVIGLTERFEESLALMKLRFGWKLESYSSFNVTRTRPKKHDLAQSTLDLIAEKNRFDIELYQCAAKVFEDAVNKNAAEISRVLCELETARIQDSWRAAFFSIRAAGRKAVNRAYSAL